MSHQRIPALMVTNRTLFPNAANNAEHSPEFGIERSTAPTFHKSQQQNKEAFTKQGTITTTRKRSILDLVPESALKKVRFEDESGWVDRFVEGLLAAQEYASQDRDQDGLDIARPKLVKKQRWEESVEDVYPILLPEKRGDGEVVASNPNPVVSAKQSDSPLQSPESSTEEPSSEIIDLTGSPPSTHSTIILQDYTASTTHGIKIHLSAIETAATDMPAWYKQTPTPSRRRSQLHRWFGLYTTWESDVAFTEEDKEKWREGLVMLTRDHNSHFERRRASIGKLSGDGMEGRRGRMKGGVSKRIMKKRSSWFAEK